MNKPIFSDSIDSLFMDCHLVTMNGPVPYGTIKNGAIAVKNGDIIWTGLESELPPDKERNAKNVYRLGGAWVTPGLIDCHTHLVYTGSRAKEFDMRLKGASYGEIAKGGGGILSTVKAVRRADEEALYAESLSRLKELHNEGVTTVEIKSGYGLDTKSELKLLRVARKLGENFPVHVSPTFLGAHALPPEYQNRADAYIELVIEEMLPAVVQEQLCEAVDVFCDHIGFSIEQTGKVFEAAAKHGLRVKLHAEQLSNQRGTILAVKYNALSVDHLEYLEEDGIASLTGKNTVAVLLPGAFYFLRETKKPPIDSMREAGIHMAVATDCNPGSSPTTSPLLMMNMACVFFGLTPEEALAGFTINAARALNLEKSRGTLSVGKKADLAVWNIDEPPEIGYLMGGDACKMVVKDGNITFNRFTV